MVAIALALLIALFHRLHGLTGQFSSFIGQVNTGESFIIPAPHNGQQD